MTLGELLLALELANIRGVLDGDNRLQFEGPELALAALAEAIEPHRKELRLLLRPDLEAVVAGWGMPDTAEAISERAAIMEHEGGLPRGLAYRLAVLSEPAPDRGQESLATDEGKNINRFQWFGR